MSGASERLRREAPGEREVVLAHAGRSECQQVLQARQARLEFGGALVEGRRIVDQRLDAGVLQHVGVIVERAQRMQRRAAAAGNLHRGEIGQHLRTVAGEDRHPRSDAEAFRLQRLVHAARGRAHLGIAQHGVADEQAGPLVVAVQPVDQHVDHQRRFVDAVVAHRGNPLVEQPRIIASRITAYMTIVQGTPGPGTGHRRRSRAWQRSRAWPAPT